MGKEINLYEVDCDGFKVFIFSTNENIVEDLKKIKDEMGDPVDYFISIKLLCSKYEIITGGDEHQL